MKIEVKEIERYLSDLKDAVKKNRYRIERNFKRQDTIRLFLDYVIDEGKAKEIKELSYTI